MGEPNGLMAAVITDASCRRNIAASYAQQDAVAVVDLLSKCLF